LDDRVTIADELSLVGFTLLAWVSIGVWCIYGVRYVGAVGVENVCRAIGGVVGIGGTAYVEICVADIPTISPIERGGLGDRIDIKIQVAATGRDQRDESAPEDMTPAEASCRKQRQHSWCRQKKLSKSLRKLP
jgi:hypothetical protein